MKVTFILKDLTEQFYNGNNAPEESKMRIVGLLNIPTNRGKFEHLRSNGLAALNISCKVGNGSFRDAVDFNQMFRKNNPPIEPSFKLEPRRGYKLATFEF